MLAATASATAMAATLALTSCGDDEAATPSDFILATTTSTVDSGLLDVLIPTFEDDTGCTVKALGVGSGEALELGESGNADALLVHSPEAEEEFMAGGHGASREPVMHNDFVLVGPPADPAAIAGTDVTAALQAIEDAEATFVSRADDSGTHVKELELWDEAGATPGGDWYLETGQGMGATLTITSQRSGYTLTDRGTYLATDGLDVDILVEGGEEMQNYYHVIVVEEEETNRECAESFSDWITSPQTQDTIAEFGVDEYGVSLFEPDADN